MNTLFRFAFLALLFISSLASVDPAQAKGQTEVSKEAVLAACRHTSGCSYDTDTNTGETAGCSPHACFFCKGSTCHQTWAGREMPGLKPEKFDATILVQADSQHAHNGSGQPPSHAAAPGLAGKSGLAGRVGLQQSLN